MPILIKQKVSVLLTGGGTGGHIYPLLAVGDWLRERGAGEVTVSFAGWARGFKDEFQERWMSSYTVFPSKARRYFSFKNILDAPVFFVSVLQALLWVWVVMPDVVFSKGGPSSFPVILAARFYRVPVVIHESDAVPSVTNRLGARFAKRVGISFDSTADAFGAKHNDKIFFSGNPLRKEILEGPVNQFSSKASLKMNTDWPMLFVVGGSQGSLRINNFILDNLRELLGQVQILHQVGKEHFKDVLKLSEVTLRGVDEATWRRYVPRDYLTLKEMRLALSGADVVLARSGSFVHELAFFGKPSILIPLSESANKHQQANAYEYAQSGAALVIEEGNFSAHVFLNELQKLLQPARAETMSQAAFAFAHPEAAEVVAREVLGVLGVELPSYA